MADWQEIPGITTLDGRPVLPRDPSETARSLFEVLRSAGLPRAVALERATRATQSDPLRLDGLAELLPQTGVAAWGPEERLWLDPGTDLEDVALRLASLLLARPIPADAHPQAVAYAQQLVAASLPLNPQLGPRPALGPRPEEPPPNAAEDAADHALTERLAAILRDLDARFLERREVVRASLLGLLAGQHVLLLGPPGTAKSQLARALCTALGGRTTFEYLLTRFTHPDELFGPVSIPGLKEEDYRRLTTGYLPTAEVAFLDEIFKANSAILNSLLALVNERVFHHGRHRDKVPLLGLVGASNELPDSEAGLGALYDRFLFRLAVPPLAEARSFLTVATGQLPSATDPPALRPADRERLSAKAEHVQLPASLRPLLVEVWRAGHQRGWGVSDRRWRAALHTLQVAAAAEGRASLSPLDLLLLPPMLTPAPDRTLEVQQVVVTLLQERALPEEDVRVQWQLLRTDRVLPPPGQAVDRPRPGLPWAERLQRRREQNRRFRDHALRSLARMTEAREALEDQARRHLWLPRLPGAVLSRHVEVSGQIARFLRASEAYDRALVGPAQAAEALLDALPEAPARQFGSEARLRLLVQGQEWLLTLEGQRGSPPRARATGQRVEVVQLQLQPEEVLDWLDGVRPIEAMIADLPAWSRMEAHSVLTATRAKLGGDAVPPPPRVA